MNKKLRKYLKMRKLILIKRLYLLVVVVVLVVYYYWLLEFWVKKTIYPFMMVHGLNMQV